MQVIRAGSAGFCMGVSLALKRLDQELGSFDPAGRDQRLITLGPIIHNPLVMRRYAEAGVLCAESPEGIGANDRVVIRAHGIPRDTEERLRASGAGVIDATCPKVKKAQLAIGKAAARGGVLLLFGEKEHPEVRGLLSYAGPSSLVFGNLEELLALPLDPGRPYFLAAQTTQERTVFQQAREALKLRLAGDAPALDTICDATRARQQEVIDMCSEKSGVRLMVVVGGFNSGNTRRLAEVARAAGVSALHVEQLSDFTDTQLASLRNVKGPVGLTAGASTPEEHIDAMQRFLEEL